jgi:hypothetical protein
MKIPWASRPNGSRGRRRQPQKSRVGPPSHQPRLIIIYIFATIVDDGSPLLQRCSDAIHFNGFGLLVALGRAGSMGRQPDFHHREPAGRLRGRPVSGQGRKVRRPRRAVLLSVAEFCAGLFLSPCRSGRNHRFCSEGTRKLWPVGLRRVHRHYLPTLKPEIRGAASTASLFPSDIRIGPLRNLDDA